MAGNRWFGNLKRVILQSPDSGLVRLQFASQSRKPFAEHYKFGHTLVGFAIILSVRIKSNCLWSNETERRTRLFILATSRSRRLGEDQCPETLRASVSMGELLLITSHTPAGLLGLDLGNRRLGHTHHQT